MGRRLGPSLAAGFVVVVVGTLYWSRSEPPASVVRDGGETARDLDEIAAPNGTSSPPSEGNDELAVPGLQAAISRLETRLQQAEPTSVAEHHALARGLGPKLPDPSRRELQQALPGAGPGTKPTWLDLAHALLEVGVRPDSLGDLTHLQKAREEPTAEQLSRELELLALLERRQPDPGRRLRLGRLFSRAQGRLDLALRNHEALSREEWGLAQALFRSAPQIRDAHLTPQLRRTFALCAEKPVPSDLALAASRLEALATAGVAGMGRHESVRQIIARAGQHVLHLANEPGAVDPALGAELVRALRLTRRVMQTQ